MVVALCAENTARLYWKEYPVMHNEKIAFIGPTVPCKELLYYGLLVNIFSTSQHIEYHILKIEKKEEFCQGLSHISMDSIIFHTDKIEHLQDMDRIILCGDEENNRSFMQGLTGDISSANIYFHSGYDTLKEATFHHALVEKAKALNEQYRVLHGGEKWDDLDDFNKNANISSVAYASVLKKLFDKGMPLEILSHLEHIRWCRFYYLNNWNYGTVRDNKQQLHTMLTPYQELSDYEKQKDRNNVVLALKNNKHPLKP